MNHLKKKLEFICDFCNTTPTFINESIGKIDKSNLAYVEPHKVIINNIMFLVFNYSNEFCNDFVNELVENDSVVNQFFLPMIKQKFDEPQEKLKKDINKQKDKLERIKRAYINGVFS